MSGPLRPGGWKDPYSSALITERQSDYATALGNATPYTPQVIVNGTGELQLTNDAQVTRALTAATSAGTVPVEIGAARVDGGASPMLIVHITIDGAEETKNANAYLAVALDHAQSDVLRGENAGRNLSYVAVVQALKQIGKVQKGREFQQDVRMPLKPGTDPTNLRVIVFVQEPRLGKVIGAAMWRAGK